MAFAGFPKEGLSFFHELAQRQDREWFKANKETYETLWVQPMQALLDECADAVAKTLKVKVAPTKIFRIQRDVRFSRNKEPYKTHCGGVLHVEGSQVGPAGIAALYVQLGLEGFAGAGQYGFDPDEQKRFRVAVGKEKSGAELAKTISSLERRKFQVEAMHALKKVPRGFDPEHPRANLLKLQGLAIGFPEPSAGLIHSAKLKPWLLAHVKDVAPVVQWLIKNVRPSVGKAR